jgi:PAS domain-containing protein
MSEERRETRHAGDDNFEAELRKLRTEPCDANAQLSELQQQQLEDAAHNQRLAAIIGASRDAIWSWTPEGVITSWNAGAERLFQYRPEENIGTSLSTLVPPERAELARRLRN